MAILLFADPTYVYRNLLLLKFKNSLAHFHRPLHNNSRQLITFVCIDTSQVNGKLIADAFLAKAAADK